MELETLQRGLQSVYDVLLKGIEAAPNWDRMVGLSAVGEALERLKRKRYIVRVFQDGSNEYNDYDIPADSELDARVMAFALDEPYNGGYVLETGMIELAKTWTSIVRKSDEEN